MKLLITTAIAATLTLTACNTNNAPTGNASLEKFKTLYKTSYDLKDIPTAITAVQLILSEDSTNTLRDSLPSMYLAVQNIEACYTTTEAALKRHPEDEEYAKYKMLCLEQLGKADELFALAKNLYAKTGKAEYMYKIASVQLVTGEFDAATKSINEMMEKYKNTTDSVDIFIDQGQSQRVPIVAACWNMKGYLFIQTQKYQKAGEAYQKAIQIFPDFVMARRNLQQLIQGAQQQR
ncbi:MAG: tetratricopeptide repeat protein [Bacteroidia bacterium]|jgi:tetratricopeptide (TPR) repeat protein|nr:tetratricopeptide repeat protein [Bacteroidia bacterium]MBP9689524.1 tetratricopeptide repeat protein [Bacteroidia bacterium]